MNEKNNSKNINFDKKILVMGLDNCGKTSIVLCLRGIQNLMSFYSLNPTKGINMDRFNILNTDITIWDYGGQEQYRNNHITKLQDQINDANKLIYVIDIQDLKRYDLALEYFKKIIEIINKNNFLLNVTIFFHKWDPDLRLLKKEIKEENINNLIKQLEIIIPSNIKFKMQKTSIYTIFQT